MFRQLPDCLETLEEAGATCYALSGGGTHLTYAPDEGATATVDTCLQRFERDYNRLGPGNYSVVHKKTAAANPKQPTTFRFFKAAEGAAVGGAAGPDAYALAEMQLKLQQLGHDAELYRLRRDQADEVKALKAKQAEPDGTDKLLAAVGQINQLFQNARAAGAAPAGVGAAAPAPAAAPAVPVDEQEAVVSATVEALYDVLGQDEAETMRVLRLLADKARRDPDQLKQLLKFL